MTARKETPLTTGTKVRLSGTQGNPYVVVGYRLSRHGIWHTFRSVDMRNDVSGYRESVAEVLP